MKINLKAAFLAIALSSLCCALANSSGAAKAGETMLAAGPQSTSRSSASSRAPNKWALLVGINTYKYPDRISSLAGSINDVEDMKQILIGKFQFPEENILVLKDSQATHAGIINAIQTHLIAKVQPGDIVVFHYSGHGSQMKDVTGKMISGIDQTIVPYDSRDPSGKVFDIPGAELHPLLLQLAAKTKNLTFILDSCHSGSLVRGATVRAIEGDKRTPPPLPSYVAAATRGLGPVAADDEKSPAFASIAAATSKENAFEHFSEGKEHGALTYFLTRQLRSAKDGATYRDVMDSVIGNVSANYPAQHPTLVGADSDEFVFGDGSSLARSYVTASPSLLDKKRVTVNIGQIQGATIGSIFEVYPPGSKKFVLPEKPVAKVQLASVDVLTSEATIISGSQIPQASRAVERQHQYRNSRMRVFFDGVDSSKALQSIRDAVQSVKYIEIVNKPSLCNIQVREASGTVQTLGADSTTLSPPVGARDSSVVDRVVSQLTLWAKWFNVLSIRNDQSEIDLRFTLKKKPTRDAMARVTKADLGVVEGDTIEGTLTNNSDKDLYVAIVDLSSDGSIAAVYPQAGTRAVLKAGLSLTIAFKTNIPKGRSIVTDILRAFAGRDPFDLNPLTQAAVRGIPESTGELGPIQELLMDSAGVTRGVEPVLSKPIELGRWTVQQVSLQVRRAN